MDEQLQSPLFDDTKRPNLNLLPTKLYAPQNPQGFVSRTRLLDQLNLQQNKKLAIVVAPAGYGKSSLLSEWVRQIRFPVAWLTLDEHDNELRRFLHYLCAAFQNIERGLGDQALALLEDIQLSSNDPTQTVMNTLITAAVQFGADFAIVIDDYQVITSRKIHQALGYLIENAPMNVHTIVASREMPPLPLSRLRARRQLIELGMADLKFTMAEILELFKMTFDLALTETEVIQLETRSEGWIAGLHMAALSGAHPPDISRIIAALSGGQQHLADFLLDEIFRAQPEDIQEFLLQTSILGRMNADLCDAVTTRTDSRQKLVYLSQTNLFVVTLDDKRYWYRYHQLFSEFLSTQVATASLDFRELHQRASLWYAHTELTTEAINHAFAAQNYDKAADFMSQQVDHVHWTNPDFDQWIHRLETVSARYVLGRPQLCIGYARLLFLGNRFDGIEHYLQAAEAIASVEEMDSEKYEHQGKIALIRAEVALRRGKVETAHTLVKQALIQLTDPGLRGSALQMQGYILLSTGQVKAAEQFLIQACQLISRPDDKAAKLYALTDLAEALTRQGRLSAAQRHYQEAIRNFNGVLLAGAYLGLAAIQYELNDLEAAAENSQKGVDLANKIKVAYWQRQGLLCLARIAFARHELTKAFAFLDTADSLYQDTTIVPTASPTSVQRALFWSLTGKDENAAKWLQGIDLSNVSEIPYRREFALTVAAQVQATLGRCDHAIDLLRCLLDRAEVDGRTSDVIQQAVLLAVVLYQSGEVHNALEVLTHALDLAESENYVRVFLDAGVLLIGLLRTIAGRGQHIDYIERLLAQFSVHQIVKSTQTPPTLETISEREVEVLRLVAIGLSNREIADQLVISVATVKTHLINIYGKFGVRNRTEAIARARVLKLL